MAEKKAKNNNGVELQKCLKALKMLCFTLSELTGQIESIVTDPQFLRREAEDKKGEYLASISDSLADMWEKLNLDKR